MGVVVSREELLELRRGWKEQRRKVVFTNGCFDLLHPGHVRLLEASGVVATEKRGRVRTVRLVPSALLAASEWLARQRAVWDARIDRLDAFLQRPESDSKDPR